MLDMHALFTVNAYRQFLGYDVSTECPMLDTSSPCNLRKPAFLGRMLNSIQLLPIG